MQKAIEVILSLGPRSEPITAAATIEIPRNKWMYSDQGQPTALLNITSYATTEDDTRGFLEAMNEAADQIDAIVAQKTGGKIPKLSRYSGIIDIVGSNLIYNQFGQDISLAVTHSREWKCFPGLGTALASFVYVTGEENIRILVEALGITSLAQHGYAPRNRLESKKG